MNQVAANLRVTLFRDRMQKNGTFRGIGADGLDEKGDSSEFAAEKIRGKTGAADIVRGDMQLRFLCIFTEKTDPVD